MTSPAEPAQASAAAAAGEPEPLGRRALREQYLADSHLEHPLPYVANVSWPRSGHHLLIRLLALYFGRRFGYCERYGPTKRGHIPCCGAFPCQRQGPITTSKNHDFGLDSELPDGMPLIVQIREPLAAITSDFELYVANGNPDTAKSFQDFAFHRARVFRRFCRKWVVAPRPNRLVIDYDDLMSHTERVLEAAITTYGETTLDRERLRTVIGSISHITVKGGQAGQLVTAGTGVRAARDPRQFRYHRPDVFHRLTAFAGYERPAPATLAAPLPERAPAPARRGRKGAE